MASQSTMTLSYRCRHKLTAHRQFGANVSASIIGVCVIPLATWFGKGDFAAGWTKAAIVWAIVPAPFYLWAIFGRKERFKPIKEGAKIPLKESIKCLAHNKPQVICPPPGRAGRLALLQKTYSLRRLN